MGGLRREAVDNERVRYDLKDALGELKVDDLRELIEAAEEFISAVEEAEDGVETWHDADQGEERAEARDGALEALQEVLDKAHDLAVWLQWPDAAESAQEARMAAEAEEADRSAARAADAELRMRDNLLFIANASLEQLDMVGLGAIENPDAETQELIDAITVRRTQLENE